MAFVPVALVRDNSDRLGNNQKVYRELLDLEWKKTYYLAQQRLATIA